jgi:hypothetical protein
MEARFPRDTERLLLLAAFFFFFFSSSDELLEEEEDPVRVGSAAASVVAAAVEDSASAGLTSVLFLAVEPAAGTASAAGLPRYGVSASAAGTSETKERSRVQGA